MPISNTAPLTPRQLTGQDESHLIALASGHLLHARAAQAYEALCADARNAGFGLQLASGFRSFARQCAIWNDKASGVRPVHDDNGRPVSLSELSTEERIHAILRFSALPGTSRHHWGSDLDVYDEKAMPANYQLQLSPAEVAGGGIFDPLHNWLDERMAMDQSHGFFRPYALDRGGVAPERWHLSYAPIARNCEAACSAALFRSVLERAGIELWAGVNGQFDDLMRRYVYIPRDWCPEPYQE